MANTSPLGDFRFSVDDINPASSEPGESLVVGRKGGLFAAEHCHRSHRQRRTGSRPEPRRLLEQLTDAAFGSPSRLRHATDVVELADDLIHARFQPFQCAFQNEANLAE
jgi:hypothetical protein